VATKSFEVTTTTYPIETLGLVASLLAATLDQGHLDGETQATEYRNRISYIYTLYTDVATYKW
jgi:hypothetical protein